jgi:hypothetical protein
MVPVLECLLTEVSHRKQSDRLKALLYRPWHEREFDKSLPQILSYIERNLDESRWDLVDLLIKLSKNPKATLDLKLPCIRILLRNSNKNPDLFSEWLQEILENADVNAKIAVIRSIFENQHWSVHFSVFLQRLLEDHDDRVVMMIAFSVYLLLHININAKRIFGTELSMMWDEVESLTRKIDCDPHELWDFLKRYRSFLMNDLSADNLLAIKLDAISLCAARESLHPLKDELKRLAQLPRNAPKMLETEEIAITAENLEALRGTIRGLFCSQNEDARQIAAFSLCSCYENFPMLRQLVDSLWLELSCDPEMKVKETVLYCIQKELENVPPGLRGRFCELCKTCSRVYIV